MTSPRPRGAGGGFKAENLLFAGFSWDPTLSVQGGAVSDGEEREKGVSDNQIHEACRLDEERLNDRLGQMERALDEAKLLIREKSLEAKHLEMAMKEGKRLREAQEKEAQRRESLARDEVSRLEHLLEQKENRLQEATLALKDMEESVRKIALEIGKEIIPGLIETDQGNARLIKGLQTDLVDGAHAQQDLSGRLKTIESMYQVVVAERDSLLKALGKDREEGGGGSQGGMEEEEEGEGKVKGRRTKKDGVMREWMANSVATRNGEKRHTWREDPKLARALMERDEARRELAETRIELTGLQSSLFTQREATKAARSDLSALQKDRDALTAVQNSFSQDSEGRTAQRDEMMALEDLRKAHDQGMAYQRRLEERIEQMEAAARWTIRKMKSHERESLHDEPNGTDEEDEEERDMGDRDDGKTKAKEGIRDGKGGGRVRKGGRAGKGKMQLADIWHLWSGESHSKGQKAVSKGKRKESRIRENRAMSGPPRLLGGEGSSSSSSSVMTSGKAPSTEDEDEMTAKSG